MTYTVQDIPQIMHSCCILQRMVRIRTNNSLRRYYDCKRNRLCRWALMFAPMQNQCAHTHTHTLNTNTHTHKYKHIHTESQRHTRACTRQTHTPTIEQAGNQLNTHVYFDAMRQMSAVNVPKHCMELTV